VKDHQLDVFSLFLLIHTYIAGSGGGPSSIEGSTQELALQGDELSAGWQSEHCVPVVLCPDFIFSPILCILLPSMHTSRHSCHDAIADSPCSVEMLLCKLLFKYCAVPHICNGLGPHEGTARTLSRQDAGAQGLLLMCCCFSLHLQQHMYCCHALSCSAVSICATAWFIL